MSVAKVIEISSTSTEGFEDAIKKGVARAAKTVDNVQGVWVKEFKADVDGADIIDYRVDLKVTFLLKE